MTKDIGANKTTDKPEDAGLDCDHLVLVGLLFLCGLAVLALYGLLQYPGNPSFLLL